MFGGKTAGVNEWGFDIRRLFDLLALWGRLAY